MSPITKYLFLSFALSAAALATPHDIRHVHHHRGVAHYVSAPAKADAPAVPPPVRPSKRSNSKRCKSPRLSSSIAPSSSSSAPVNVAPSPSPSPSPPAPSPSPSAAVNVAPSPPAKSTSEKQLAPPASSKEQPPPSPTSSKEQPPPPATHTSAASPAPAPTHSSAPSGNLPSFLEGTQTGQGTFYATGLGACGITNQDSDHIAAVSHLLFDAFPGAGDNPNDNPACRRKVTASYQGKTVQVTITDRCQACELTDLDFSPSAFDQLADPAVGRISGMTWVWD